MNWAASTFQLSYQIPANKIYFWPQGQEGTVAEPSESLGNYFTWICLVIFPFSAKNLFTSLPLKSSALPTFLLHGEKWSYWGREGEIFRSAVYLPDTVLGILYGLFRVELQKLLEADGYE